MEPKVQIDENDVKVKVCTSIGLVSAEKKKKTMNRMMEEVQHFEEDKIESCMVVLGSKSLINLFVDVLFSKLRTFISNLTSL